MNNKLYLLPLICAFCACSPAKQDAVPQDALAKIGIKYITQKDFDNRITDIDPAFLSYINTDNGKHNFLGFMVNEQLLSSEAQDRDIPNTKEYKIALAYFNDQQAAALKQFEIQTQRRFLLEKLGQEGITDTTEEEVKTYYKRYSYQINLLQIIVVDPEKASEITRELKKTNNRYNFESAVRKFSVDPVTKSNGGKLQPFIPGEYMPEIEVPAANTPLNQVQGFFKTPQGFHIFMKVGEEKLSYNEAKDRIKQILEKQKMDAYLAALKDKFGVEVINEVK